MLESRLCLRCYSVDQSILISPLVQQVLLGVLLLAGYLLLRKLGNRAISSIARRKQVSLEREKFISKAFGFGTFIIFASVFTILLDLGFGDISLFLSSIFAVLGVALVAQWSMLSNLTASVLIFFVFPYRIGDEVKVSDKDDDISGVIIDITMFHVMLRHASGNIITYPNSLILQKGVTKIVAKKTEPSAQEAEIKAE